MHRNFVNGGGRHWEVWEVRPSEPERRAEERRRVTEPAFEGPDRRTGNDRRIQKNGIRSLLPVALAAGWLSFASGHEVRRYAPVPDNWTNMTPAELSQLCAAATIVRGRR